ncbi:MAG: alpha/beta hydrolase [bacterium]
MSPIDPQAKALLTAMLAAANPPLSEMIVGQARTLIEGAAEQLDPPVQKVGSINDLVIPGPGGELPLRIYTPPGQGPFPVILFIHGGGWVLYRPKHYDSQCTYLCAGTSSVVISVDYRRSPETKFPGPLDDCLAALNWTHEHGAEIGGDPSKIIICGDSAGGNLAAGLALKNRDDKGPVPLAQVLIYPVVAWYEPPTGSFSEFADGYSLTRDALVWFWDQYLVSKDQAFNPYVIPMNAERLEALPEALIIVAGYDPLRDEAIAYGEKLRNAGVPVTLTNYEGMIHGFLSFPGILDDGKKAIEQICQWLNRKLEKA